jgi:bacillithiol system protein YtxJ
MGFFDKLKKTQRDIVKEEIIEIPWHVLSQIDQLDAIIKESLSKPVIIFKHSTRCGISRMVLKEFEKSYNLTDNQVKLYFLDLLQNRDLSNEIAARFKVIHESPQLLIIKNGLVVHHDSHNSIDASHIEKYI